jgi:hypothetical protein
MSNRDTSRTGPDRASEQPDGAASQTTDTWPFLVRSEPPDRWCVLEARTGTLCFEGPDKERAQLIARHNSEHPARKTDPSASQTTEWNPKAILAELRLLVSVMEERNADKEFLAEVKLRLTRMAEDLERTTDDAAFVLHLLRAERDRIARAINLDIEAGQSNPWLNRAGNLAGLRIELAYCNAAIARRLANG